MDKKGFRLILIGIAIVAIPFYLQWRNDYRARQYIEAFEEENEDETKKKKTTGQEKEDALLEEEGVIGIIQIESLNLKLPIFEGADNQQLDNGIGHLSETTELCGKGNCVLAGHNGSRKGLFFSHLSSIQTGAKVVITNQEKITHTYEVTETSIVGPYDSSVRAETEEETLTLFTCAYHGTQRFVVRCKYIN